MYPVGCDLRPGMASTKFRNPQGLREGRGGHVGANFVCDLPSIFLSTCDRFPLSHPTSASAMGRFRFSRWLQNPRSSSDRICPNNPSNFYTNHLNYFFTMKTVRNVLGQFSIWQLVHFLVSHGLDSALLEPRGLEGSCPNPNNSTLGQFSPHKQLPSKAQQGRRNTHFSHQFLPMQHSKKLDQISR